MQINKQTALFGAGGKMGARLSEDRLASDFRVSHIEPGAGGRARLKDELGIDFAEWSKVFGDAKMTTVLLVPRVRHEAPVFGPKSALHPNQINSLPAEFMNFA